MSDEVLSNARTLHHIIILNSDYKPEVRNIRHICRAHRIRTMCKETVRYLEKRTCVA